MYMLSAAEVSNPRGKHPLPARPLLRGRSAACRLCPLLPCEEAGWGPLQQTVCASSHRKCCCPQPAPWPQKSRQKSPTPPSKKSKRLIIPSLITSGWRGDRLFGRDPQQPGGSQDVQERGVWEETERHGARAGERWGRELTSLFLYSFQEHYQLQLKPISNSICNLLYGQKRHSIYKGNTVQVHNVWNTIVEIPSIHLFLCAFQAMWICWKKRKQILKSKKNIFTLR